MNDLPIPIGAIRSSFDRAAAAHNAARARPASVPSAAAQPNPSGASRQIAGSSPSVQAASTVEQAIANASRQTSVDFDFLVAQAQVESAMNPDARARTSSATGLYQFIESTWLGTMQRHGERFGLGGVASQIGVTQSGSAYVADPAARDAILAMRSDPQIASFMAAGLAEDNRAHLAPILGRQPEHNELYLAHFLGAGGAGRFLSEMADNPGQSAADLFRRPAAANRPVFYERNGSPRSLAGVMDYLSGKLQRARADASTSMPQSYAAAPLTPPSFAGADAAVFGQRGAVTLAASARSSASAPARLSLTANTLASNTMPIQNSRGSMSSLLQNTFGDMGGGRSTQQVQRAYSQLRALGL